MYSRGLSLDSWLFLTHHNSPPLFILMVAGIQLLATVCHESAREQVSLSCYKAKEKGKKSVLCQPFRLTVDSLPHLLHGTRQRIKEAGNVCEREDRWHQQQHGFLVNARTALHVKKREERPDGRSWSRRSFCPPRLTHRERERGISRLRDSRASNRDAAACRSRLLILLFLLLSFKANRQ